MTINIASHRFKIVRDELITEDERNLWLALFAKLTNRDFDVLYSMVFAPRESHIYELGFEAGTRQTLKELVVLEHERIRLQDEMRPSATASFTPHTKKNVRKQRANTKQTTKRPYIRNSDVNGNQKSQDRFR